MIFELIDCPYYILMINLFDNWNIDTDQFVLDQIKISVLNTDIATLDMIKVLARIYTFFRNTQER